MPRPLDRLVDCRIDLFIRDVSNPLGTPVEKMLKLASNRGTFRGRRRLSRRRCDNAYFFIGLNWPTQKLLDCGFDIGLQLASLMNGNALH